MSRKKLKPLKWCGGCKTAKPLAEFYMVGKTTKKPDSQCKPCRRAAVRAKRAQTRGAASPVDLAGPSLEDVRRAEAEA